MAACRAEMEKSKKNSLEEIKVKYRKLKDGLKKDKHVLIEESRDTLTKSSRSMMRSDTSRVAPKTTMANSNKNFLSELKEEYEESLAADNNSD